MEVGMMPGRGGMTPAHVHVHQRCLADMPGLLCRPHRLVSAQPDDGIARVPLQLMKTAID